VNINPTKSKILQCCPEKTEATRVLIFVNGTEKKFNFYDDDDDV
jgi:hypothetical protein